MCIKLAWYLQDRLYPTHSDGLSLGLVIAIPHVSVFHARHQLICNGIRLWANLPEPSTICPCYEYLTTHVSQKTSCTVPFPQVQRTHRPMWYQPSSKNGLSGSAKASPWLAWDRRAEQFRTTNRQLCQVDIYSTPEWFRRGIRPIMRHRPRGDPHVLSLTLFRRGLEHVLCYYKLVHDV